MKRARRRAKKTVAVAGTRRHSLIQAKVPDLPTGFNPHEQAKRLGMLLRLRGWSQVDLADATGIAATDINKVMRGTKILSGSQAWRIANATRVSTEYVLYGETRNLDIKTTRALEIMADG